MKSRITYKASRKQIAVVVKSISGNKTIKVVKNVLVKHKTTGKYLKRHRHYQVHDADNVAKVGDRIFIVPTRPISKTKNHMLIQTRQIEKSDDVS